MLLYNWYILWYRKVIFDTTLWLVQGADVQKQLLWYLSFLFVSAVWQGKKSIMLHTCVVTYYFTAQDKTVPHRGQAGLPEWRLLLSTSDQTSQLLRDGIRLLTPPNLGRKQSYHKVMLDIWHIVFSQLHIQNTKFSINGVTHKLSTICVCVVSTYFTETVFFSWMVGFMKTQSTKVVKISEWNICLKRHLNAEKHEKHLKDWKTWLKGFAPVQPLDFKSYKQNLFGALH